VLNAFLDADRDVYFDADDADGWSLSEPVAISFLEHYL